MAVKHFEDLEVWQETRRLTRQVYRLTKPLENHDDVKIIKNCNTLISILTG